MEIIIDKSTGQAPQDPHQRSAVLLTNGTTGRTWLVRVIKNGEPYGLNDCLVHDDEDPLVELWLGYNERGNMLTCSFFGGRYYASTLQGNKSGMSVEKGPEYVVDADFMRRLNDFVASQM